MDYDEDDADEDEEDPRLGHDEEYLHAAGQAKTTYVVHFCFVAGLHLPWWLLFNEIYNNNKIFYDWCLMCASIKYTVVGLEVT